MSLTNAARPLVRDTSAQDAVVDLAVFEIELSVPESYADDLAPDASSIRTSWYAACSPMAAASKA